MFKFDDGSRAPRGRDERARRIAREMEAFHALREAADRERDEMLEIVAEAILREFETMASTRIAPKADTRDQKQPQILVRLPNGLRLVQ